MADLAVVHSLEVLNQYSSHTSCLMQKNQEAAEFQEIVFLIGIPPDYK
jgi:hypothetical protein